jgi:ATP-binding cassette subfamily C protein
MHTALIILKDVRAQSGRRFWLLLVLFLFNGLSDGVSMALLYPLLRLLGIGGDEKVDGAIWTSVKWLFDVLGMVPTAGSLAVLLIVSVVVQGILFTAQNWLLADVQKGYVASWQRRLFRDFLGAEWTYFASRKTGEMLNLVQTESARVGSALLAILQIIVIAVILAVYGIIAVLVAWKLTLYLCLAGTVMFGLARPIRLATRRLGAQLGSINVDLTGSMYEVLGGAKLVKANASEAEALRLVEGHIERLRHNLAWSMFLPTSIRSGFELGGMLTILGALFYSVYEQRETAELLIVVALVARLFPRLLNLQQFNNAFELSSPAYAILAEAHERFAAHRERGRGGITSVDHFASADIRAIDLTVRYGEKTVIDHVSLLIPAGKIVGIVGPSGAGKSTLVDVLTGLNRPTSGSVIVGGVPLTGIDGVAWRKRIGYVPQEAFLFHDTIANNIGWSAPERSREEILAAAGAAGLEPLIASLPLRENTVVGDRGAMMSGGQRQRVSLARAILRQPIMLLLDEATSALDSLAEREVMDVIENFRGRMSIIVVAHRLAAVRGADLIYVLDHGKIVEQGTWAALSQQKALFHRLVEAQSLS